MQGEACKGKGAGLELGGELLLERPGLVARDLVLNGDMEARLVTVLSAKHAMEVVRDFRPEVQEIRTFNAKCGA